MQQFRCENCGQPVYFPNDRCGQCGARLGFVVPELKLAAFRVDEGGRHLRYAAEQVVWRPCSNYTAACRCNWMVADYDLTDLCISCRLTTTIPNQSLPENRFAWLQLERAKRTWLYTILGLGLPVRSQREDPQQGLAFHFIQQLDAAGRQHVHDAWCHAASGDEQHVVRLRGCV